MTEPILARWTGETFLLARRHLGRLKDLVAGEDYVLHVDEVRSVNEHQAFFATVKESWATLPEDVALRFPSADHLRKYALIKSGFCTKTDIVCASNSQALILAETAREMDSYALVALNERTVTIWRAESQAYKAMGKERFTASQRAVRDYVAHLLDVPEETLPSEESA